MAEREDPETTRAAHWRGITAGLMGAAIVAYWSRPGIYPGASLALAATGAALWLVATVIAGTLAMALAGGFSRAHGWRRRWRPAMNAAAVWVLIPPLSLLALKGSAWLLALVAGMAMVLALCLWAVAPRNPDADEVGFGEGGFGEIGEGPHFAELPPSRSGAKQSTLIAVFLEAALVFVLRQDLFWGTVWLAVGSLLLTWKMLAAQARPDRNPADPRARLGGALVAALAVVVALLLLRPPLAKLDGAATARAQAHAQERKAGTAVNDAYRGIVLFTVAEKKRELPPLPVERDVLHAGTNQPVVIPFDGTYWYFQAPQHGPGLHPHLAHGDPLALSIFSTGWVPLAMQAHQTLARAIPLHGGESFELTLRNGDNREGRIDVGVLLSNSHGPVDLETNQPKLMLGFRPILSTEEPEFAYKRSPVEEDVTFAIPLHPGLRKFDTITVLFSPSEVRDTLGARVGIRQFALLPR